MEMNWKLLMISALNNQFAFLSKFHLTKFLNWILHFNTYHYSNNETFV